MTLVNLGFATALGFKALIDLGFKAGFRATLRAATGLIFSATVEDLVFQIALGAAIEVTLEVVLGAINIAALGAK